MNRVLMLAGVLALTALAAADAPAAGLLKKRGGCGCSQAAPPPAAYAPPPAAPCCGVPAVPTGGVPALMPGMVMPAAPAAPAPVAPAAPGHQHHSTAPAAPATVFVSADLPAKADMEVTLTGTLVCAKCGLKEPGVKKCTNALRVKEGEKTVTYFLDDKGAGEDYHEGLCGGGTKEGAKVTGTVTEKDGKKWVKATKVEEKK